ncbi:MAG TPA: AAA family ATPase [Caulobacteraceae bacterium]|nr:AAA family ATPase [Caulobacteraceae bacterium]
MLSPETWLSQISDRVIETHCARIYLAGDTAWKLKKPVDLGYLDFVTIERRRWALERELAFNSASAPDIYRRLRAVTREGGGYVFDGEGEVVEYALEMRRFDDGAVLDRTPQAVDGSLAEQLGRTVARLHAKAPVMHRGGGAAALGYTVVSNAGHLRRTGLDVEALIAATDEALAKVAPLLDERAGEGFARRCHGDLHLGNILLEAGRPVLFDCIEFNDRLCEIDVLYDLAFLLMDLQFRGRADAASRALSAYLDEAARRFPDSLWYGLAALPLMQSVRAAVRCHVRAQAGDPDGALAYLAAAIQHLEPPSPRLCAVGGFSGSGKSTFARELAPRAGVAVVLRTDEIRKRLWGAAPTDRLPPAAYTAEAGERVYGVMLQEAQACLLAGRSVVLDAVFLRPEERTAAQELAVHCGVPFSGVWLDAPAEVLRGRLGARSGDASDADVRVLAGQLTRDPGPLNWKVIDARGDFAAAAAALTD